jgi:hypothetical protein
MKSSTIQQSTGGLLSAYKNGDTSINEIFSTAALSSFPLANTLELLAMPGHQLCCSVVFSSAFHGF